MDDIVELLKSTGLTFAYHHFAEGHAPEPPYILYLEYASDNFSADGQVYAHISEFHFELYTDLKTPDTEKLIEDALDAAGIFYEKDESWIELENLYEVLYRFERQV